MAREEGKCCKRVSGLATVAMIAGSVVFGGAALAADIGRHTIKFASTGAKGAPIVLGMEKFAEILSQKSGGQITVKSFPNGTRGEMSRRSRPFRAARSR